jgi:hypothetical protein
MFVISKAILPTGDAPVCGVSIEPFGALRQTTGQSLSLEDAESNLLEGSCDAPYQLRMRWYRYFCAGMGGQVKRGCQLSFPPPLARHITTVVLNCSHG